MKPMCIILSFSILLAGCYTNTPLTKDGILNLDNKDLIFYLTDETYIWSQGGQHHRVENGYKVVGTLDNWDNFDGIVRDEQITEISLSESNVLTLVIIGGVLVLAAVGLYGVNAIRHGKSFIQ